MVTNRCTAHYLWICCVCVELDPVGVDIKQKNLYRKDKGFLKIK